MKGERQIVWQVPSYWAVLSVLKNPTNAGAYAYFRSKNIVRLEEGGKRKCLPEHASIRLVASEANKAMLDEQHTKSQQPSQPSAA